MPNLDPLFLERPVVCDLLGFKRTRFFAACRDKELDRVKQGRKTLVTMESVRRYADKLMLQLAEPKHEPTPDGVGANPQPATRRRQPARAQNTPAAPPSDLAAPDSPPPEPPAQHTDFDDSWLTLAGVASEQL